MLTWIRVVRDLKVPSQDVKYSNWIKKGAFDLGMFKANLARAAAAVANTVRSRLRYWRDGQTSVEQAVAAASVRDVDFETMSGVPSIRSTAPMPSPTAASAGPVSSRIHVGPTRRCTARSCGRCGCLPASEPRRTPTARFHDLLARRQHWPVDRVRPADA